MPIRRATDTSTRDVTAPGVTELQRLELSSTGSELLPLKGIANIALGTGGEARLILRAIDDAGKEVARCERQVLVGGTYTIALRDAVKGFSTGAGTVDATAVVLELDTGLPGQVVNQTQLVAMEFEPGTGAPAMRSHAGEFHEVNFPEGGAKVDEMVKNTDAVDLVAFHGTCSFDWSDVLEGDVWVRFLTDGGGGAYHEVFRFQDREQYLGGGVHVDQVRPGFDSEPDGSFPVDKVDMWFDPGAGAGQVLGIDVAAFFVGVEV